MCKHIHDPHHQNFLTGCIDVAGRNLVLQLY
ncbi:MAG: hypothetical protein ACI8UP_004118 [Porticoccaceae bacterium]|jgi:hypothetical protein